MEEPFEKDQIGSSAMVNLALLELGSCIDPHFLVGIQAKPDALRKNCRARSSSRKFEQGCIGHIRSTMV